MRLGTLKGTGALMVHSRCCDGVDYDITATSAGSLKQAHGFIRIPDLELGNAALMAGNAVLLLEDGHAVDVLVTGFSPTSMDAEIAIRGDVPGICEVEHEL
ncbi:MAG TPA: hypothetical protein VFS01_11770 [Rhizomicrobium sp.]|jgi:hypothetical protein|nr:hypothetical protein [Rhizomicrobium sp.]HVZ28492.1 hypothetical protein [Rhizomicrobium sp.]